MEKIVIRNEYLAISDFVKYLRENVIVRREALILFTYSILLYTLYLIKTLYL